MKTGRGSGRPTVADVAAKAGVSPITVSRTLRTPDKVSPELREQVMDAIEALGYAPDPNARALASARSDVIGVIIPSLTNSVFSDVLTGMYEALAGSPYQIHFANNRFSPLEEERLIAGFIRQKPAALIIAGFDQTEKGRGLLRQAACPIVQIMETGDDPVDMVVGFSHRAAGAAMTRHLIEAGYRRVGFLGARMDPRTLRRLDGFKAALTEAGLYDPARCATTPAPSTFLLGRMLLRDLLARHPDTDAVFCNNDDIAMGALFECQHAAIRVPQHMGIAGFNDLELMEASYPSVTSVRTFRFRMGYLAIDMALKELAGNPPLQRIVDVGFELKIRDTTNRLLGG